MFCRACIFLQFLFLDNFAVSASSPIVFVSKFAFSLLHRVCINRQFCLLRKWRFLSYYTYLDVYIYMLLYVISSKPHIYIYIYILFCRYCTLKHILPHTYVVVVVLDLVQQKATPQHAARCNVPCEDPCDEERRHLIHRCHLWASGTLNL